MRFTRVASVVGIAVAGAALLSGCGSGKMPPGREQRLLKAAGVTRCRIICTKDL